jgi:hypothetical protein
LAGYAKIFYQETGEKMQEAVPRSSLHIYDEKKRFGVAPLMNKTMIPYSK